MDGTPRNALRHDRTDGQQAHDRWQHDRHRTRHPEVEVPFGIRLATAWTWRLAVIAVGVYGLLLGIAAFQVVVVPVLLAVLIAALLRPLVDALIRRRVPVPLAALIVLLGALLVVGGLLAVVGQQIVAGFTDLGAEVREGLERARTWLAEGPADLSTQQIADYLAEAQAGVTSNSDQLVTGALSFTTTAGHVVTGFFLTVFAGFFFLAQGSQIWAWVVGLFPRAAREPLDGSGQRAWVTLTSYVRATIIVAFVDAVGIGAGAAVLQVPLALPLAVLVFLGAFVPIVGALVSGGVAVLVALLTQGPVVALILLGVVVAVQQLESHVLQPFLLGRAVSVHPLAVILAIASGILAAGVLGALFAVPLIAVGNTVAHYLSDRARDRRTESDRPPEEVADDKPHVAAHDEKLADGAVGDSGVIAGAD